MQDNKLYHILCLRMCCASWLSVSLHRIKMLQWHQEKKVFYAFEWKLLLCQQDYNVCFSASEIQMLLHRSTNIVSLPRNKCYCYASRTMTCVYQHQNYKCLCNILWTFYTPIHNDIYGIIDVDAQLKYIIINDLGMSEMRCFKVIPHHLIMLFVV